MRAYAEEYLNDVVENQGKLFDFIAQTYPDKDTEEFINTYMVLMKPKLMSIRWMQRNFGIILIKQKTII